MWPYNARRQAELDRYLPPGSGIQVYSTNNTGMSFADLGSRKIYLAADICDFLLNQRPSVQGNGMYNWPFAAKTLYHEWWHIAAQETDELKTEAGAWSVLRQMLRTYWGMDAATAQKMYDALGGHPNYAGLPDSAVQYAPNARDPELGPQPQPQPQPQRRLAGSGGGWARR